jgi:glutamine amidotransferase
MKKVVIVDYGIGNLQSVSRACQIAGIEAEVTHNKETIINADGLILPGVGAFGNAMLNLEKFDLINLLKDYSTTGRPIMGICLGMQLLLESSVESPEVKGLGIIQGSCEKFPNQNEASLLKVPQIQWNTILPQKSDEFDVDTPLESLSNGEFMYFVHSYYASVEFEKNILSTTKYGGIKYVSSIRKDNVFYDPF